MRRSQEEKKLLQEDMINTIRFMTQKVHCLKQASERMDTSDSYMAGGYSLIKQKLAQWNLLLMKAIATFSSLVNSPNEFLSLSKATDNSNEIPDDASSSSDEEYEDDNDDSVELQ